MGRRRIKVKILVGDSEEPSFGLFCRGKMRALEYSFELYQSDYEIIDWVLSHTCGRNALRSP